MQLLYHIKCNVCLCFNSEKIQSNKKREKTIKNEKRILLSQNHKNVPKNNHSTENGTKRWNILQHQKERVQNKNKKMLQTSGAAVRHHTAIFPYFKNDHNSTYFFWVLIIIQSAKNQNGIGKKTPEKKIFELCIFWS